VSWLLTHATGLNLGISAAQFAVGVAIGFWGKPELLTKGKSAEWAFGFWTSQWLVFSVTYLVIIKYPTHEAGLLLLLDVQSLLVLASASTLMLGEPLKLARTLLILAILCAVFAIYNFGLDPWDVSNPPMRHLLRWSLPSQTLSIFSLNWIAFVVCLRYRRYAVPFLLVAIGYSACQQALYAATILRYQNVSQSMPEAAPWYLAVAVGKLLFGAFFYGLTFLILPSYPSLLPSYEPQVREEAVKRLKKAAAWTASALIFPFLFAVLAAWLFLLIGK